MPHFALAESLEAKTRVEVTKVESTNIVAKLPGSDPALKDEFVVLKEVDHTLPSQWRIVPPPTAHASLGPLLQTPLRGVSTWLGKANHPPPFQWRIMLMASPPTTHTSFGPLPPMPRMVSLMSLAERDHALPSQCTIP